MGLIVAGHKDQWSKWWWIAYFGLDAWTPVERKVRIALGMTATAIILIIYLSVVAIFTLIGVEPHYGAAIAAIGSIVPGFMAARPVGMMLFPDSLQRADENSQRRLRA